MLITSKPCMKNGITNKLRNNSLLDSQHKRPSTHNTAEQEGPVAVSDFLRYLCEHVEPARERIGEACSYETT